MENQSLKYLGLFFLVAAAQGLLFSIVQLSYKKSRSPVRIILSLIIITFSLTLIESGLWWTGKISDFPHFIMVSHTLPFLFGPLVYFYYRSVFTRTGFRGWDLFHLLPFVIYTFYCSQFYFNPLAQKQALLDGTRPFDSFFILGLNTNYAFLAMAISHLMYACFIMFGFYKEARVLKEVKNWFFVSFAIYTVYFLNFIVFHALSFFDLAGGCADYGISSGMSVFIYLFAWLGYVRPKVFDGYSLNEALKTLKQKEVKVLTLKNPETGLIKRLQELMVSEKLYKDEEICLESLAKKLNVSRNQLSETINATGMNFFEYINYWRIQEAKKILSEHSKKEFNIIEAAYEVGFSNKVSFNKFFKKLTGQTPTEFRKSISAQKTT